MTVFVRIGTRCAPYRPMATPPRRMIPGTTLFVTRRTTQRQFFLRPSAEVNQVYLYNLGFYLMKHQAVDLHSYCAMPNHPHLVATDGDGNFPDFMRDVNGTTAQALNVHLDREENFWSSGKPNYVDLAEGQDVIDKITYTLANPVAARLVRSRHQWPGAISSDHQIGGRVICIKRPRFYYNPRYWPDEVWIRLGIPPPFRHLGREEYQRLVVEATDAREDRIRQEVAREGAQFGTKRRALLVSPFDRPKNAAKKTPEKQRKITPRIAAKNAEVRKKKLSELQEFLAAYRAALARFVDGERDVVFPYGTFKMRRYLNVTCAGPPTPT